MDEESEKTDISSNDDIVDTPRAYAQSASLLASREYGKYLSSEVMKVDPFYALHDLFSFCANAENQLINTLHQKANKMDNEMDNRDYDEERLQAELVTFRYHKTILRGKIDYFNDVIKWIKSKGGSNWPSVSSSRINNLKVSTTVYLKLGTISSNKFPIAFTCDPMTHAKYEEESSHAAAKLLRDYEELLEKAKELFQLYNEKLDDIKTNTSLLEARKSLAQSKSIGRLSLLAFFFLPLSFTTSLFGMNFREIGEDLSIWIWVAVSVPVFCCTLILCFWPKLVDIWRIYVRTATHVLTNPIVSYI